MHRDYLRYALGGDAKSVVGLVESIEYAHLGVNFAQSLVVDYEQRIHVLCHLLNPIESLVDLACALEAERDGDDAHREDAHVLANAGYHGSCASARATAHARRDERHARAVVELIFYLLQALLGSRTRPVWPVACAKPLLPELQLHRHGRIVECLCVGVAQEKRHVVYAGAIHIVDGVPAAASHAYHLDDAFLLCGLAEVHYVVWVIAVVCHCVPCLSCVCLIVACGAWPVPSRRSIYGIILSVPPLGLSSVSRSP